MTMTAPARRARQWRLAAAAALGAAMLLGSALMLARTGSHHHSPYAGEEKRELKSFSAEDIRALRQGEGWGLAKAAELNGVPGPAHLLEMQEEIALTPAQVRGIEAIRARMTAEAIRRGEEMLALEKALEEGFQRTDISDTQLAALLEKIGITHGKLRHAHLAAHLHSAALLSQEQIRLYNELRGYGDAHPCENTPAGHDAEMWRKHNDCD